MKMEVEIDPAIFNDVYIKNLDNMSRVQIFFGGAGSGKSVFAAQRAVIDVMRGGRNYLIARQVARTINRSVFNEVLRVISDWDVYNLFSVNKSDFTITCKNGYQILFVGLDDPEKIKSITPRKGALTDIIVDEATETEKNTIKQLFKRQRGGDENTPKRLTLLFNPILQSHWIYGEYFSRSSWTDKQTEYKAQDNSLYILKTTYKDNRFLTNSDRADLENETDEYFYQVYTLGNWGILGEVIFTNWQVEDLSDRMDQFTNRRNGLDFGFSSDPAAIAVMHLDMMRKELYIIDEFYERGLTNQLLAVETINLIENDLIVCDSSEPKSIQELREKGVNAIGAKKGKDSVNFGVQWLQGLTIIINAKCVNAKREFSTYHWKKDRDGNALRIPVDKDNHLIDAVRYGTEDDASEGWLMA